MRSELGTARCRSAILPHDGVGRGARTRPLPHDDGLSLVRDADRVGTDARAIHRLTRRLERAIQDLDRVVLDPPGLRVILRDLAVCAPDDSSVGAHDEAVSRRPSSIARTCFIDQAR